jgi:predicted TIM-barrel fold metal-dependent hydrolase
MIIDCHTHIGPYFDFTVDDLLKSMDEAKIDRALVFAGELFDVPNEWLLKQIAPHKDRLYGVAAAHPIKVYEDGSIQSFEKRHEEIKRISDWYGEGKVAACKFYTGYDHYHPADNIIQPYLTSFENVGCPAIFHMGDCLNTVKCAKLKYAQPLDIDEVAVEYPNMNFIIAHMGYPWQRDAAEVCFKNSNVYADISGFVYGDFTEKDSKNFTKVLGEFCDIAGNSSKLLFGTDTPISNQKSYIDYLRSREEGFVDGLNEHSLSLNVKKAFNL